MGGNWKMDGRVPSRGKLNHSVLSCAEDENAIGLMEGPQRSPRNESLMNRYDCKYPALLRDETSQGILLLQGLFSCPSAQFVIHCFILLPSTGY